MSENKCKIKKNDDNKDDLKKELDESNKKMEEYLSTLQHLQAEFENYRKRVEKEKEGFCKFATQSLIEEILPVMDDFDLSMKQKTKKNHEEFVKAIEMIHDKLKIVLKNQGLEKIDAEGKPFNPELHEPLLQEESNEKPNTVIEVFQNGYTLNGKILRHSRVKLSKTIQKEEEEEENNEKNISKKNNEKDKEKNDDKK
jgi:molecular chaperone GrpE